MGDQLYQLTRARVVLFLREPEAVFWVLVFPLILAVVLGWAFRDRGPSAEDVGVLGSAAEVAAVVELVDLETYDRLEIAEKDLAFGRIAVLLIAGEPPVLRYDPQRPESELARLRLASRLWGPNDPPYRSEEVRAAGSRYIDWLFPGLLGMNLMGTGIWGIGFAIAEMRQKKLLRRFLVTPMSRSKFLMSFMLSRGVFLVLEVVVLVAFAVFVLGVPLRGSVVAFFAACLVGTLTFATIGILVASRARTIEGVSGLMNFVMVPMWLFSGIFFSYDKFPEAFHPAIRAIPLTALNDALRGIMLEGTSLFELAPEMGVMALWCALAFATALKVFRWE